MQKRLIAISAVSLLMAMGIFGTATAQKVHAPKGVWIGMAANLSDLQDIMASLMVFNMERIASTATELAEREIWVSQLPGMPDADKKGYEKVAEAAKELAAAARTGEEKDVNARLSDVVAACSACHYDLRDQKRRQKLE